MLNQAIILSETDALAALKLAYRAYYYTTPPYAPAEPILKEIWLTHPERAVLDYDQLEFKYDTLHQNYSLVLGTHKIPLRQTLVEQVYGFTTTHLNRNVILKEGGMVNGSYSDQYPDLKLIQLDENIQKEFRDMKDRDGFAYENKGIFHLSRHQSISPHLQNWAFTQNSFPL